MSLLHSSSSGRARARTAALALLAGTAYTGSVAGPAQAIPIGPCDGPCPIVSVYRTTNAYSTPYFNARYHHVLKPSRYIALCEAYSTSAGPYRNRWWTKLREGTWVNNGYLRGGVKMGIGDCPAPRDDAGPPTASVPGGPIARAEVLARSLPWIQRRVMYSQKHYTDGYRQDCSGYVSLAWHLRGSPNSSSLRSTRYTTRIPKSALRPGDALGHPGHIALFVAWASPGRPVVREEYDYGHPASQRIWSARYAAKNTAYRYKGIR